ncbi:MAG: TIM barrel protein [Verrucomicrobiota bacterium]
MPQKQNRRNFLKCAGMTAAGAVVGLQSKSIAALKGETWTPEVHLFSKHLQFLDYQAAAKAAKDMGFDGLEYSVRPRGHVEPENVKRDLPRAIEAHQNQGLSFKMMVTNINSPQTPYAQDVLETASALGCRYYRMGYLRFDAALNWRDNLDAFRSPIEGLAKINESLNLHGAYQNHSGNYVGSYIPDLAYLLEGINPTYLGSQYDIRHATVEGGKAWKLGFEFLKDHIRSIVIKDFRWESSPGKLQLINTPFGEGCVDFKAFFKLLAQHRIKPIVSLHTEYDLGGAERGRREITWPHDKVLDNIANELQNFRKAWKQHYTA